MSSLRKLERSVIRHKSYQMCGSNAMFHYLWNQHHYKNAAIIKNPEKKSKKRLANGIKNAKKILSFVKNSGKKKQQNITTGIAANVVNN